MREQVATAMDSPAGVLSLPSIQCASADTLHSHTAFVRIATQRPNAMPYVGAAHHLLSPENDNRVEDCLSLWAILAYEE